MKYVVRVLQDKKKIFAILICSIGISANAIDYTAMQISTPAATMQSVNSSAYMSSGSTYTPTVYTVGASSPSAAAGPRKAPPGGGGASGYDPNNPPFSPIGDALFPLLLFALAYGAWILTRRKKIDY